MPSVESNHGSAHDEAGRCFSKVFNTIKPLPVSSVEFAPVEHLDTLTEIELKFLL